MSLSYRCWAEVDLNALRENLAWIRHRVGPKVKILTVVKADAYGHGLRQIAGLLMQSGTDVFGVANLTEATHIRSVGHGWPILLLGACLPAEIEDAVRQDVMLTVSSASELRRIASVARRAGKVAAIQLKVDTGMSRLGAPPEEAWRLAIAASRTRGLRLAGVYTHFAAVEDDATFSRVQAERFEVLLRQMTARGISLDYVHSSNSGGLLYEPNPTHAIDNTVRPGLLVYGVAPPARRTSRNPLTRDVRTALSWKCRVSLVKEIPRGATVSYGRTFTARRRMRLAVLTAGYGDGFMRTGSNRARVLIRGQACPIVGRITMDQMMADVSRLPRVRPGDEVVLIGRQKGAEITAAHLARWFGTIPWEVLTAITYRVPRIYRGSHAA